MRTLYPSTTPVNRVPFVIQTRHDNVIVELTTAPISQHPTPLASYVGQSVTALFVTEFVEPILNQIEQARTTGRLQFFSGSFCQYKPDTPYDLWILPLNNHHTSLIFIEQTKDTSRTTIFETNRTLIALQSAAAAINYSLDFQQVIDTFAWEIVNLLTVSASIVLSWEPNTDSATFLTSYQTDNDFRRFVHNEYTLSEYPVLNRVISEKATHQINFQNPPEWYPEHDFMALCGAQAMLVTPLVMRDRVAGVIILLDKDPTRTFSNQDITFAQLLVSHTATAISNAQLYEQSQRNIRKQVALRRASAAISSTLELDAVLHHVVEQMASIFDATSAYIYQYLPPIRSAHLQAIYIAPNSEETKVQQRGVGSYLLSRGLIKHQPFFIDGQPAVWQIKSERLSDFAQKHLPSTVAKTILGVPMQIAGKVVAFAEIWDSRFRRHFTEDDIAVVQAIAQQAAIAYEHATLHRNLEQSLDELHTLNHIIQTITSTIDLDEALNIITTKMFTVIDIEAVSIALIDDSRQYLQFAAAQGGAANFVQERTLPIGQGIMGWVAQQGRPLIVPDVKRDDRHYSHLDQQSGFQTRSMLCLPLNSKGQTIGVLALLNKRIGNFDTEDLRRITMLSIPVAAAIENAKTFQQAQQEVAQRRRVEAKLAAERASLAQRVAEQTAELRTTNEELARAVRLKDEFLASMSHELRTPLNAILGITEGLLEEIYGSLSGRQAHSLSLVQESGQHLLALINDILDVARIEAEQLSLELDWVNVHFICETSLNFIHPTAERKGLTVHTSLDPAVDYIQADSRRLKQIVTNLLSNAVKFTPDGGTIGLEVKANRPVQTIDITIWDTGIGIAPEDHDQLFQPFVQLDGSLARRYEGTGLGLHLVKKMTEMHGGSVTVTSRAGEGSRFTVTLPWQPAGFPSQLPSTVPNQPTNRPPSTPVTSDQPLILIADDDTTTTTSLFAESLEIMGCRVIIARNGREVVHLTAEERPDLILMDIQMPEMNGLDATRTIRADATYKDIPIIILSAKAMQGDREIGLQAGANEYLSKPCPLSTLRQAIARYVVPVPMES